MLDPRAARTRHHGGEDERVDRQQQEWVDERPQQAERRAAVARLQLARDETLDEGAMPEQLPEAVQQSGMGRR